MGIEKSPERLSHEPKSLKEHAMNTVRNIQSLQDGMDINKAFPRMAELMKVPDAAKTFQGISDLAQVCKGQNDAADRVATRKVRNIMDPEESHSLV